MIVLRHECLPSEDWRRIVSLWVEWRDAHPNEGWRVYNSITDVSQVVVVERTFEDDDVEGICDSLFEPYADPTPELSAWLAKWEGVDVKWGKRQLWRLAD